MTGTPVFDENGTISSVVTNVSDISELNELRAKINEYKQMSSFFSQTLQEHKEVDHALQELVVKGQAMVKVVQKRYAGKIAPGTRREKIHQNWFNRLNFCRCSYYRCHKQGLEEVDPNRPVS